MKSIKDSINGFISKFLEEAEFYNQRAIVTKVDKSLNTCNVLNELTETEILNVNILAFKGAKFGLVIYPVLGSVVNIGFNEKTDAHILNYSEVEAINILFEEGTTIEITSELIKFNGGELGGLTITPELVENLNKNNEILNALLSVLTGATITEPGNGAPSALQIALSGALTGKQTGDFSNIENEKIKQ